MPDAAAPPADRHDDPTNAVWQEYPVSLFGDAMWAVTVLLGALVGGCALAILLVLAVQLGFAGVLSTWIPADQVEAWGIAAFLVAILTTGLAAAAPAIPGWLTLRSLNRTLVTAVGEQAPRTQVPHPVQQRGPSYWTGVATFIAFPLGLVAGIYLLVRILVDPGRAEYWIYAGIVLGYILLLFALDLLRRAELRRWLAQLSSSSRKKAKKKRATVLPIFERYWSKPYRGAVWTKAARAAGFDSIDDARRAVTKAHEEEDAKQRSRLRPPQLGGGGPPIPTRPDATGPEWVYRDQPPAMWAAIRIRWYALLAAWGILLCAVFLARALVGDDNDAYHYLEPGTIAVGVVMGVALLAGLVALLAEVVLAVIWTRERAELFATAGDPGAARPDEGVLVRASAPRRLGLARAGALVVGMALPFVIAAMEATGDQGSYFEAHAGAVDAALWACIVLFAGCVLVQTIEYHYGRAARNRLLARWPSLWHETDLTGW